LRLPNQPSAARSGIPYWELGPRKEDLPLFHPSSFIPHPFLGSFILGFEKGDKQMADLMGNYEACEKPGALVGYNVATGVRIFKGALVAVATATGLARGASDGAGQSFIGVAYEECDNRAGGDGEAGVRVKKTGSFVYRFGGARTQAVIGQKAYAVDDNGVALAAATANDVYVGDIVGLVGSDKVRVRIDRAAG